MIYTQPCSIVKIIIPDLNFSLRSGSVESSLTEGGIFESKLIWFEKVSSRLSGKVDSQAGRVPGRPSWSLYELNWTQVRSSANTNLNCGRNAIKKRP